MHKFKHTLVLALIFLLAAPFSASAQCAMCRAALMTSDNQAAAEGINHGITYLMVFPYLIVGVVAFAAYRIMKKEHSA